MADKNHGFMWACGQLREAIDKGIYGNLTFSMKEGNIVTVKTETFDKPPVDNDVKSK